MIFICLFSCAAIWLRHGASLSAAASADYIDKPFGDDDQHPTAYYNNSPQKMGRRRSVFLWHYIISIFCGKLNPRNKKKQILFLFI
jgi:hypothetical protein